LNFRLPQTLKFTQITALVPFSTATPDSTNYPGKSQLVLTPVGVEKVNAISG
jgi:hypothetical protein